MVLILKRFLRVFRTLTPFCQSGVNVAMLGGLGLIAAAAPADAGPTGWAHQAAGFQSNAAVTVKSLSGGSYAGTQNPTGAVAKANQSAATQAPTVIIQATSSGVFNFTTDCFLLTFSGSTGTYVGAGKLDGSNAFTGLVGKLSSSGGNLVMNALLQFRMFDPTTYGTYSGYCSSTSCLESQSYASQFMYSVVSMATTTRQKCYP